jgi:hypothetical protein
MRSDQANPCDPIAYTPRRVRIPDKDAAILRPATRIETPRHDSSWSQSIRNPGHRHANAVARSNHRSAVHEPPASSRAPTKPPCTKAPCFVGVRFAWGCDAVASDLTVHSTISSTGEARPGYLTVVSSSPATGIYPNGFIGSAYCGRIFHAQMQADVAEWNCESGIARRTIGCRTAGRERSWGLC